MGCTNHTRFSVTRISFFWKNFIYGSFLVKTKIIELFYALAREYFYCSVGLCVLSIVRRTIKTINKGLCAHGLLCTWYINMVFLLPRFSIYYNNRQIRKDIQILTFISNIRRLVETYSNAYSPPKNNNINRVSNNNINRVSINSIQSSNNNINNGENGGFIDDFHNEIVTANFKITEGKPSIYFSTFFLT